MSRDAIASHISSHTLLNILANFFRIVLSGTVLIYVARQLGPDEYGIVSLGLSIAAIAGLFCDFGISTSVARYLAESKNCNPVIYQNGRLLNLIFSLFFSLLLFLLAKPIATILNVESPAYIQIICIFTFFTGLFHFSTRSLQGLRRTDRIALLNFLQNTFASLFIFLIAYFGFKACGVLFGHGLAALVIWAISMMILRRYFNIFSFTINLRYIKKVFFYALPLLLTSSSYFLLLRGPAVLLSSFAGPKEVSFLNIPMRIIEILSLPAYSLSIVASPFFTQKEYVNGNLSWLYVKIFKYLLLLYLPITVYLVLSSSRLINVVFGVDYIRAASVLLILSLYLPFFAVTNFSGTSLDFLGFAKQKSFIFAIATACAIICAFLLIPTLKEIGAALAIAIPYTLFSIYTIVKSAMACKVKLRSYIVKLLVLLLTVAVSCLLGIVILFNIEGIIGLIVSFACFAGLFVCLALILRVFNLKEIQNIMNLMKKKK